uniref:Secreted protein n=1 Tax=Romanomermis culicivorax TaxID=13658 RepID=A0A915HP43_ROMCU
MYVSGSFNADLTHCLASSLALRASASVVLAQSAAPSSVRDVVINSETIQFKATSISCSIGRPATTSKWDASFRVPTSVKAF